MAISHRQEVSNWGRCVRFIYIQTCSAALCTTSTWQMCEIMDRGSRQLPRNTVCVFVQVTINRGLNRMFLAFFCGKMILAWLLRMNPGWDVKIQMCKCQGHFGTMWIWSFRAVNLSCSSRATIALILRAKWFKKNGSTPALRQGN